MANIDNNNDVDNNFNDVDDNNDVDNSITDVDDNNVLDNNNDVGQAAVRVRGANIRMGSS